MSRTYLVVDSPFNRHHAAALIGRSLATPPSYVEVVVENTSPMNQMTPFLRYREQLFAELETHGMHATGNSTERYWSGFATVQVSLDEARGQLTVERYYDNELIDVDRHFHRDIPTADGYPPVATISDLCRRLVASVRSEEGILDFAA